MTGVLTRRGPAPTRYVEHVMGMPISLALRGRHAADAAGRDAWAEVMATLRDVDRVFSTWRRESFVSRLDRGEVTLADGPPEVAQVLALGERAARESYGAFATRLPGPDGREHLDPSGVVKGWAVERAARALRRLADTDFALSAGGDMVVRTLDPAAPAWRVGVEDPHDPGRVLAVLPVHTGAVATSGTAHRGAHLVDARTGLAPRGRGLGQRGGVLADLGRHRRDRGLRARPGRRRLAAHPAGSDRAGGLGRRHHHEPRGPGPDRGQALRRESTSSASVLRPAQPSVTASTFLRTSSESVFDASSAASPRSIAIRSSMAAFTVLGDRPKMPSELIARSRTP